MFAAFILRLESKRLLNDQVADTELSLRRKLVLEKQEPPKELQAVDSSENTVAKKPFVEPEVSVPVDVLEATTFQQPLTSGAV